ncbi:hypothetical protein [Sinorhizobium americanum]|uniref:hypothetical protein n=1 Tax=Sinorhizobium americanum TaxID=194963 RepID=UPI0004D5C983|nr:hypothetical protein [Sinorhizobium americanum]
MTRQVELYFDTIAGVAQRAVAAQNPPPPNPAPVFDTVQDATATAWSAVAVHPMSVLETEYVSVVQQAERSAGNNNDEKRERAFEAMSKFFVLSSEAPSLLQPDTEPLADNRIKDLNAQFDLVATIAKGNASEALAELKPLIQAAAEIIAYVTNAQDLEFAGENIQAAATYLQLFEVPAENAAEAWATSHADPDKIGDYIAEVDKKLIQPLLSNDNAVASARSLYNIAPFYLFRLMHRFIGGDQAAPMDLDLKGVASGAATKAMHPPQWDWLIEWHETQIVLLKDRLSHLNTSLKASFETNEDVIRFFLKGGRAMFTALGDARKGENDWDTGILLNPNLSPEDWYSAYAAVNDTVSIFLDQARYGYTALLNRHKADLQPPSALSRQSVGPVELRYYSRLALQAEQDAERTRQGSGRLRPLASGTGQPAEILAGRPRTRPVGVNGELIDVGLSKRNTVELMEHWLDVKIVEKEGVVSDGIPVPQLPYFVDDFSTIIREALATNTADRKLAKRLVRLKLVLESDDDTIVKAVKAASDALMAALPDSANAFGAGLATSTERLATWVLAGLIQSIPDLWLRQQWQESLDSYIAAQAPTLLAREKVAGIWQQVVTAINPADQVDCQTILAIQYAISTLSRRVVEDGVTVAQAIGGPDLSAVPLWKAVETAIGAVVALNSDTRSGMFYIAGLAGRMQTMHADLSANDLMSECPDGGVEIFYRPNQVQPAWAFRGLQQRLVSVLTGQPLTAELVSSTKGTAVVVKGTNPINNLAVSNPSPILITILQEPASRACKTIDFVNGWPIASTRDLVRLFLARAADSHDFDLRQARKASSEFLLSDVLGQQLR